MDGTDEVGSSSWYTVTFVLKGRKVNGVRDVPAGQRHVTVCRSAEAIEGRRPETARDPSRDARAGPWPLALSLSVLTYGYLVRLSCLESRSSVDHITHGRCTTHDSPQRRANSLTPTVRSSYALHTVCVVCLGRTGHRKHNRQSIITLVHRSHSNARGSSSLRSRPTPEPLTTCAARPRRA